MTNPKCRPRKSNAERLSLILLRDNTRLKDALREIDGWEHAVPPLRVRVAAMARLAREALGEQNHD